MKKRSLIIRIISIALCALIVLGIVSAAIYAFADTGAALPNTGSNRNVLWFAVAGIAALAAIIICAATNKKK